MDKHEKTVSLIIFLTDGRPTLGEVQSSNILINTKNAIREKFCLFSIGIGNDVDFQLLEKLSLENCGMMRRVSEDDDAAVQLKGYVICGFHIVGKTLQGKFSCIQLTYLYYEPTYWFDNKFC